MKTDLSREIGEYSVGFVGSASSSSETRKHVAIHHAAIFTSRLVSARKASHKPRVDTLYQVFNRGLAENRGHFLGKRHPVTGKYSWITYLDVDADRTLVGSALVHLAKELGLDRAHLALSAADKLQRLNRTGFTVGIFLPNCQEWVIIDQACHAYGITNAPMCKHA